MSTAKAWESLLGRGNSAVTSFIVESSVYSFISYRNRDDEIAHCAKGLATAKMKLFTAQSGYRNRDDEIAHCAKWLSQPR